MRSGVWGFGREQGLRTDATIVLGRMTHLGETEMRGSMIRHKSNVGRIIHHLYAKRGSTMVMIPWLGFMSRERHAVNRKRLATDLRALRKANRIPKGWSYIEAGND
jgi:hypothetical protein